MAVNDDYDSDYEYEDETEEDQGDEDTAEGSFYDVKSDDEEGCYDENDAKRLELDGREYIPT